MLPKKAPTNPPTNSPPNPPVAAPPGRPSKETASDGSEVASSNVSGTPHETPTKLFSPRSAVSIALSELPVEGVLHLERRSKKEDALAELAEDLARFPELGTTGDQCALAIRDQRIHPSANGDHRVALGRQPVADSGKAMFEA